MKNSILAPAEHPASDGKSSTPQPWMLMLKIVQIRAFCRTAITSESGPRYAKRTVKQIRFLNPKNKIMKLHSTSLAAALVLALGCSPALAADEHADHKARKDPMTEVLKDREGKSFESTFLSLMIHHHQSGKKMAAMAKDKATDPELKKMAAKIEKQQGEEIDKMTGWLKEWYDKAPDSSIVPDATKIMEAETSAGLEAKKGEDFDHFFAMKMAEHHAGGIAMAKLATEHAEHAEAKSFAKEMIQMQSEEREKLLKHGK